MYSYTNNGIPIKLMKDGVDIIRLPTANQKI